jgi:hypothetical protein
MIRSDPLVGNILARCDIRAKLAKNSQGRASGKCHIHGTLPAETS